MTTESPFLRSAMLLGEENVRRLARSAVLLCGVGGVGSYVAEGLARAGVGRIGLVDHDRVALSNCNRQLIALHSTLGQPKAQAAARRIQDINPDCQAEVFDLFYGPDTCQALDLSRYDYIVDAVDTVTAKLTIAEWAQREGVPLISCMGTGNKLHPELFEIADLSETSVCPLCKVMRREMKARGIPHLKVLYSREQPVDVSRRMPEEAQEGRRAVPGSISFVPPAAGLLIAGEVIRALAGIDT